MKEMEFGGVCCSIKKSREWKTALDPPATIIGDRVNFMTITTIIPHAVALALVVVVNSTQEPMADDGGHGPDHWQVTGVAPSAVLRARAKIT